MQTTMDPHNAVEIDDASSDPATQPQVFDSSSILDLSHLQRPVLLFSFALGAGIFSDLLLVGKPLGISFPLATLLFSGVLLAAVRTEKRELTWGNVWLLFAALLLASMSAVRAAPFVRTLNIIGSLGLMLLFVRGVVGRPLSSLNMGQYVLESLSTMLSGIVIPFPFLITLAMRIKNAGIGSNPTLRRVAVGLLITLPLLIVFTALFAAADLIFGNIVRSALEALYIENLFVHAIGAMALTWLFVSALVFAVSRNDDLAAVLPDNERTSHRFRFLGSIESSIVLFSVDALFSLFVVVQFAALFGGERFIEAQGLTYSEYARRGFFELVAVAVLVMTLVLSLDFLTKRESKQAQGLFLAGCSVLVTLTVVVLASAFQRMALYEQAFGFTQLRVYTHIFMVWLAIMLSAFLMMLYQKRTYMFATGLVIGAFLYVMTLNVINPEALIVRQNVARFAVGEELDVRYTSELSSDAVPYLLPLLEDEAAAEVVGPWLAWRLDRLDLRQDNYAWPAYHISINRAHHLLDAERDQLEAFDVNTRYRAPVLDGSSYR